MKRVIRILLLLILALNAAMSQPSERGSIRDECLRTLPMLTDALLKQQVTGSARGDRGALVCPETQDLHTRAGEAIYPFAVMYKNTGEARYRRASIDLGNWLISQQAKDGEWPETPWAWTGTTADQLLMLSMTYPIVESHLTNAERLRWRTSIERAAAYLVKMMSPDFATINYCATTPATLAVTNSVFPDPSYLPKARQLARQVLSKMNADGFIEGEAARVGAVKYGVDPAYEFDMSFWGLLLYARIAGDSLVASSIRAAVKRHLPLVYPDGLIDGSWGARCYKWTTYGSKTADGSQILFSLLSPEDARYRTAALRNLAYLRTMIRDGVIGNGPQYFDVVRSPACNYPTFARAKNLAMAIEWGDASTGDLAPLPSEEPGMFTFFPSVGIAVTRSAEFMTTISGYGYVDQLNWGGGRYSQFPSGGSACNLWVDGYGLLQTSSPTRYVRGEVIHMPEIAEPIKPHTSRIEFADTGGYFTNLYERFGQMSAVKDPEGRVKVTYTGELRDERHLPGGVAYSWTHQIEDRRILRTVQVRYHDRAPEVSIIEPMVWQPDMAITPDGDRTIRIRAKGRSFRLRILDGMARLVVGEHADLQWQPFPALRVIPIALKLDPPAHPFEGHNFSRSVTYEIVVE